MKVFAVCLALLIATTNALPKQEPESCQVCRDGVMVLLHDLGSAETIEHEKKYLIERVCPLLETGCEDGVNNWWDEMAAVLFAGRVATGICHSIDPNCDTSPRRSSKAWDCEACIANMMSVGNFLSSDEVVEMATNAFQDARLCLDESLELDADEIEACQDFVAAFVPLALPAMFDDLEVPETAQFVCFNLYDELCSDPGMKTFLNKY